MNPFLILLIALVIFIGNLFYSVYSIKILKDHSLKLSAYKSLKEENLKLRAEIEKILSVKELERYAVRRGFKPFNWEEFAIILFREDGGKDRSRKRRR
jgi:hypothetical protein